MEEFKSYDYNISTDFKERISDIVASLRIQNTEDVHNLEDMVKWAIDRLYLGTFDETDKRKLALHPRILGHKDFQELLVDILDLKGNHNVSNEWEDGSLEGFKFVQQYPEVFRLQSKIFENPVIQDCLGTQSSIPEHTT